MNRLAIIGAGDLGELIAHHAHNDKHYEVVGFYDDFKDSDASVSKFKVLGKLNNIEKDFNDGIFDCLMVGIGYKFMVFRKNIFQKYYTRIPFGNVIHTSSYIDSSVILGEGIFILPGCTIDKDVILGNNVLVNTAAIIAHDSEIRAHSFISPAANIAGKTIIDECCIIGINATIIDNLRIAPFTQIAGGSVVIKSIDISGLYAGIPAQFKKTLI